MKQQLVFIVLVVILIVPPQLVAQGSKLSVVATTTLIADVARHVGGELATVTALIPPGSDVHAFQPTPQDAVIIAQADVVLVNGGNLEEGLLQLVEAAASAPLIPVSDGVAMRFFGEYENTEESCTPDTHDLEETTVEAEEAGEHRHSNCDPHVWGDPGNVAIWAANIADALAASDPAHEETYRANAAAYIDELTALNAELESLFATIPDARRVLVTNHDFLSYFAARYDFEIVGTILPAASTLAEPAPQDVAALIDLIKARDVPAIFVEVSDAPLLATMIAGEIDDVEMVTLYSDSLSTSDGPAATYVDYMRYNAQTIAAVLTQD